MIRLASATHLSQMYTRGPATSFETCVESLPQNEHFSVRSLNTTLTSVDVSEQQTLDNRLMGKLRGRPDRCVLVQER
jgi:hypothetical protein